jgi:hypothetical protein
MMFGRSALVAISLVLDFRTFEVVSGHADAAGVTMSGVVVVSGLGG